MEPGVLPAGSRVVSGALASGRQFELHHGRYAACVASVGASLRVLRFDDRDLVVPFDADVVRPYYRGATLAPWPNRVVDGRYRFADTDHQLALTEPSRGHALHGLVVWLDFEPIHVGADSVSLVATVQPQAGYPWRVRIETSFTLAADGLTQRVSATNLGATPAPVGLGPHPYLRAGSGPLDDWALELPADRLLDVDSRLAPVSVVHVEGDAHRFDFRRPRRLGAVEIDHAFTGLARDADGIATVRLTTPDGDGVRVDWDAACEWVQIHTADLPGGSSTPGHRCGLAVEPMTCAPDAFNAARYEHDTGLTVVDPDDELTASWTVSAIERIH
jgi:aldose 1-epimerase